MTQWGQALSSVAVGIGLLAIVGCEQPNHQAALAARQDKLARTVAMLQDSENEQPEKMQRTLTILGRQHAHDVETFEDSLTGAGRWVERDFERWQERQPIYAERIRELIQGDPANIDRTLPRILY